MVWECAAEACHHSNQAVCGHMVWECVIEACHHSNQEACGHMVWECVTEACLRLPSTGGNRSSPLRFNLDCFRCLGLGIFCRQHSCWMHVLEYQLKHLDQQRDVLCERVLHNDISQVTHQLDSSITHTVRNCPYVQGLLKL
jgi:hypothetical protein